MPGDDLGAAADGHLVDIAADQNLAMAVGDGHGVIVVACNAPATASSPVRDV